MLALAGRKGLGSNTRSIGLGDMGSELAAAFDEAFFDYPGSFWSAPRTASASRGPGSSTTSSPRPRCAPSLPTGGGQHFASICWLSSEPASSNK